MPAAAYADYAGRVTACQAMLVCDGGTGKILTATCGAMLGLNGFAAFLSLAGAAGLLLAAAWGLHAFDVRLHEYWAALQRAGEDPGAADAFATLSPGSAVEWRAALLDGAPRATGVAIGAALAGLAACLRSCSVCLFGPGDSEWKAAEAEAAAAETLRREAPDPNRPRAGSLEQLPRPGESFLNYNPSQ